MRNKEKLLNLLQIIITILFMISVVPKTFQNDTFFTIALGERVATYGIEQEEQLAWHEGLEYTNSRWLFDILIFALYDVWSFFGIYGFVMLLGSLQGILYYIIISKITNKKPLSLILTVFVMYVTKNAIVARAQIVSFTLFLLEFYCIEELLKTKKKKYFIILTLIPIILVNMHASVFPMYFVFYLPYIAEYILSKLKLKSDENSKIIIEKRNIKAIIVLIILGIIASVICPKELEPYSDMFSAMEGVSTNIIAELEPINILNSGYMFIFIVIAIAMITFTKTKVRVTDCFFILGFTIMAFSTYRCIYFFYYISTICIIRIINDVLEDYNVRIDSIKIKRLSSIICYIVLISFSIASFSQKMLELYIDDYKYPVEASNYILSTLDVSEIKLYNHLNFGSYLEYKKIPVFIDSRTGMYTEEFNEGVTILKDFANLSNGIVHYQEIFDKYEITHALIYTDEIINNYISKDVNWKCLYQDDSFVLYERVK